jgi:hypothetical protein
MYKKIKTGLKKTLTALTLATVLYSSAPVQAQPILERPLTQQTEDFYESPRTEFRDYLREVNDCMYDGYLTFEEIDGLAYILDETLKEIKIKISDEKVVDKLISSEEGKTYLQIVGEMNNALVQFRKHTKYIDLWKDHPYYKGDFWHYGVGIKYFSIVEYENKSREYHREGEFPPVDNLKGVEDIFRFTKLHEGMLVEDDFHKLHLTNVTGDYPPKTKIPYWPGLFFGWLFPFAVAGLGCLLRRKDKDLIPSAKMSGAAFNSFGGWLITDGIHPVMYPARLIGSVALEFFLYASSQERERKKETTISPVESKKSKEKSKKKNKKNKNPFDYEIPSVENIINEN